MSKRDLEKLVAVMRSYERKSNLPGYDMWGRVTRSYNFKMEELKLVTEECAEAGDPNILALDAACGFGVYSLMLSKKGYTVVALDVSTGMLKKARELVGNSNRNVWFVRASITHLPLEEKKFNLVVCVDTLHHFTDSFLSKTLTEFRRVIQIDGVLIADIRNALNPAVFLQYQMKNRKWAEDGGLVLKSRYLGHMKRRLMQNYFAVVKMKGVGFFARLFAPYVVIFSKPLALD